MLNLSLNELKQIEKMRCTKGYKNLYKERLLIVLSKPKSVKSEKNLGNARIKKIRKGFNKSRYRFSKLKIKEIKKIFMK